MHLLSAFCCYLFYPILIESVAGGGGGGGGFNARLVGQGEVFRNFGDAKPMGAGGGGGGTLR
jgi:hypothetical protein